MEYKIKFNNFLEFMELKSIIMSKRRLLRNNKSKLFNYLKEFYLISILFICLFSLTYLPFGSNVQLFLYLGSIISLCTLLSYLLFFLVFVIEFNNYKEGRSGKLLLNEDGLVDYSDLGYMFGCSWDRVSLVVVGKYNTVVFFDMPWCMYVNNKDNKKLLKSLKKYSGIDAIHVKNEF